MFSMQVQRVGVFLFSFLLFPHLCFAGKEEAAVIRIQRAWRAYLAREGHLSGQGVLLSCGTVQGHPELDSQEHDLLKEESLLEAQVEPESDSAPSYQPDQFYKGIEGDSRVNCLSYSLNLKVEIPFGSDCFFDEALTRVEKMELLLKQLNQIFPSAGPPFAQSFIPGVSQRGYHCVGFFISHSPDQEDGCLNDVHFVRQDQDGTWSHKLGKLKPTQLDARGARITHVDSASMRYEFTDSVGELFTDYKFVDYFLVRNHQLD